MLDPNEFLQNPIIKGLITQARKGTEFGLEVRDALETEDWSKLASLAKEYNDFMYLILKESQHEIAVSVYNRIRGEA